MREEAEKRCLVVCEIRELNLELTRPKSSQKDFCEIQGKKLGQKMLLTLALWFVVSLHKPQRASSSPQMRKG